MDPRRAFIAWGGPERDILTLLLDDLPKDYGADPDEDDLRLVLYRVLDENEEATGEIVGVEIVDFLTFDRWGVLPDVPQRWQVHDAAPLPLRALLQRLQVELRERAKVAAHA